MSTTPNGISFRLFVNIQDVLEDASDDEDALFRNKRFMLDEIV